MYYTPEQAEQIKEQSASVLRDLHDLQLKIVAEGQPLEPTSRLREHLLHGAARRVSVIRRSVENVFAIFPPTTARPISQDALADVQINLHAFLINLYGIYDNWAWAYVLRHNLETKIGDRRRIGLFLDATRRHLPAPLREYLSSPTTTEWHEQYAKSFRDALAHRIPPYIPPAQFTPDEGKRYNELESEKVQCILGRQWERLDQVYAEQAALGIPCFTYLHAFTEDTPPRPILIHPQILSDAMAVVEFGRLFLEHWRQDA